MYFMISMYQRKNKKLGYDSDEIKWEIKEYEQQRRKLLNEKRLRQWSRARPQLEPT